jgi:hypothetical protein
VRRHRPLPTVTEVLAASLFQLTDLGVNITTYRDHFHDGLPTLLEPFYTGPPPIHQGPSKVPEEDKLSNSIKAGEYDLVYLVTCEGTMLARPRVFAEIVDSPTTRLVCVMHFVWQIEEYKERFREVAATGRMTVYVLSHAVKRLLVQTLSEWAQRGPEVRVGEGQGGCVRSRESRATIPVRPRPRPRPRSRSRSRYISPSLSQIFTLPETIRHSPSSKLVKGYDNAGIQGGITQGRRDYRTTFDDLVQAIRGGCRASAQAVRVVRGGLRGTDVCVRSGR